MILIDREEKLKDSKKHLMYELHKNEDLKKDLVYLREDIDNSLKRTCSSHIPNNLISQGVSDCRGLGYQREF